MVGGCATQPWWHPVSSLLPRSWPGSLQTRLDLQGPAHGQPFPSLKPGLCDGLCWGLALGSELSIALSTSHSGRRGPALFSLLLAWYRAFRVQVQASLKGSLCFDRVFLCHLDVICALGLEHAERGSFCP